MIEFSERQRRAVANGLTVLSIAVVFAFVAVVAWAVLKVIAFTAPAIVPLILGFFLALFFRPYYLWWKRIVRNPTLALVTMLATVFVPLGIVLWCVGSVLVEQLAHLLGQGPELVNRVLFWFRETFPSLHSLLLQMGVPYEDLGYMYTTYGPSAMKAGAGAVKCLHGVATFLLSMVFFVFFLMTAERRGSEIVAQMPFLKVETRQFLERQIDTFVDILVSFFQRQTVICLVEGVMYGLGFWLVGLPYGFLIGFALGVMNLIPFFGSVFCLPIALALAYFVGDGSLTRLLMTLGVWLSGQLLDGYFITPRIQGGRTGLGYAGVVFSFFFWAIVLGPVLGMLLAIPLSAFCVVLWRAVKAKYIRPVV